MKRCCKQKEDVRSTSKHVDELCVCELDRVVNTSRLQSEHKSHRKNAPNSKKESKAQSKCNEGLEKRSRPHSEKELKKFRDCRKQSVRDNKGEQHEGRETKLRERCLDASGRCSGDQNLQMEQSEQENVHPREHAHRLEERAMLLMGHSRTVIVSQQRS